MLRSATPYLRRIGANAMQKRGIGSKDVHNAKDIAQGEAKGKTVAEAPTKPSDWKGTQRGHLGLGVSGVLCAGILYWWVSAQKADKAVLADKNHKGESKQFPAASH